MSLHNGSTMATVAVFFFIRQTWQMVNLAFSHRIRLPNKCEVLRHFAIFDLRKKKCSCAYYFLILGQSPLIPACQPPERIVSFVGDGRNNVCVLWWVHIQQWYLDEAMHLFMRLRCSAGVTRAVRPTSCMTGSRWHVSYILAKRD